MRKTAVAFLGGLALLSAPGPTLVSALLADAPAGPEVFCGGTIATILGTAGPDTIFGTAGLDVIAGLGGNDVIYGRDGDDVICGGEGDDRLFGNRGDDELYGDWVVGSDESDDHI